MKAYFKLNGIEVGCDEVGRGCLAGPVYAAAVVLPKDFQHPLLNDSKKLSASQREKMREIILEESIDWAISKVMPATIDKINILNASFRAMHLAIARLKLMPERLLIDGNRFKPYKDIEHHCIIKGDGKYTSIAAASILAKTARDQYMGRLHQKHPQYMWKQNMGYPTQQHRKAIKKYGPTNYHRKSFRLYLYDEQGELF
jgi:ribonuclease HII